MKRNSNLGVIIVSVLAVAMISFTTLGCDGGSDSSSDGCDASYLTTTFQAENATIVSGDVESEHSGYTGSGYANTDNAVGNYIEFTVTAKRSGKYMISFYYAVESGNRYSSIEVNGSTVVSRINFTATGSWTTWDVLSRTVSLNSGVNTIRVTASQSGGLPNMDKMDVYGFGISESN